MLEHLERQTSLTNNQRKIVFAAILGDMLDFFDFYLIGFVLAFIVSSWQLTYGQSAMILLSSGLGAVPGALFWGWLADRIGRRKVFIMTALNFSIATGVMALTPEQGGWIFLSFFRFLVGFGVSGLFAVDLPLVQEFVPTSKRGLVGGLVTSCLPLGSMLGAILGAYLAPVVGWRGLFVVGLMPALITLLIRAWVPESPRWLIRMGRIEEARQALAWALQTDPSNIALPTSVPATRHMPWRELFHYPRSMVLSTLTSLGVQTTGIGLVLWAPTLFAQTLAISPAQASFLMIWVALAGLIGRFLFSWLSEAIGRRPSGVLLSFGAAVFCWLAGVFHADFIGGVSLLFLGIMLSRFFGDGGYAVVGPYAAEVWPAGLRASGMGFGYGLGNFGKVLGPLGLALIAGSSNYVNPKADLAALGPAMNYLAAWSVMAGFVFLFLGFETRGRSLEEIDAALSQPDTAKVRTV
ncbi:MAG TPA: MFS transporter [Acetobacteraceae bacterium]